MTLNEAARLLILLANILECFLAGISVNDTCISCLVKGKGEGKRKNGNVSFHPKLIFVFMNFIYVLQSAAYETQRAHLLFLKIAYFEMRTYGGNGIVA